MTIAAAFADLRADYSIGKQTRFRRKRQGVTGVGHNADWHYRLETDFIRALETSRDIDRNDVVVGQGINRAVDNIIQDGLKLDPETSDPEINVRLKTLWQEWGDDRSACHAAGRFTWNEIERLMLRHVFVDGDVFGLPLDDGTIDTVESHRCRTPRNTKKNVVHGILVDRRGRPNQYWFTKDDVGLHERIARVSDMDVRRARDEMGFPEVIHVYCPDRVSQTRGMTALARIVDAAGMHDDIQFAKLVQQQIVSCFGFIHKREWPTAPTGPTSIETLNDGTAQTLEGVAPGMKVYAGLNDEIQAFSPSVPNAEFFQHAHLILTFLAINLGIPLAVLLLDPEQTNFSGWRGAMDQARLGFRRVQKWFSERWHREVYRWKVRQWIETDPDLQDAALSGEIDIYAHKWRPPSWRYIEPLKEAQADLLQMRNALNSPRRIQAEKGREWKEVAQEMVEDNAFAIELACEAANKVKESCGVEVHWREILSLPTPDGFQLIMDGRDAESGDSGGGQAQTTRQGAAA